MSTIRAFIAIDLPSSVRSLLNNLQNELRNQLPTKTIRWVPSNNIHLTLKFLGDTEVNRLSSIANALDLVAKDQSPFNLNLARLGCFPNPRNPRVLWIGLQGDTEELIAIHQRIEKPLIALGWEPERRKFHPHLTLGRVKNSRQLALAELPWGHQLITGAFVVDLITLFESQLQPDGAKYTSRHHSKFKA